MLVPYTNRQAVPLRGGMVTNRDKALLPSGTFSQVVNLRPNHPGFKKRPGQISLHTSGLGNTVYYTGNRCSLYQFITANPAATYTLAQARDNIKWATNEPPTVTSGSFGTTVMYGNTEAKCATWATLSDHLIMSNGGDQHTVFMGADHFVKACVIYEGTSAAPAIPAEGRDASLGVVTGAGTSISDIGTNANNAIFICCHTPANRLTFDVGAINSNSVTSDVSYRKYDGTWANTYASDGTESGGATFAQDGTMYWSYNASNEVPWYMFGVSGFWYRITFSGAVDSSVSLTTVTYGTTRANTDNLESYFFDVVNVWDGIPVDALEVHVYDNSNAAYNIYGSSVVSLGDLELDENDKIYVGSIDPLCGLYVDPGYTPNTDTTSAATISTIKYWDGDSWVALSNVEDGTVGSGSITMSSAGWVTWGRPSDEEPQQFNQTQYYGYWYEIILDDAVSTDVIVSIQTMPYFDTADWGRVGIACCSWAGRMCYASDQWGQFVYISKRNDPMILNGYDYGVLEAGDGRSNQVLAMDRLFNELIVWQGETGKEGGCTTLFEGNTPRTYGKLILSSSIGIINNKCHAVVDGVLTSTATEEKIKTLAFWISRQGVCVSDGRSVSIISDDIQNYFDPSKPECIRRGYEESHWLAYDSTFNIIRIGLVSGSSATAPNKYFCFDLIDKCWYEDDIAQTLHYVTEVQAGSGDVPVVQVGMTDVSSNLWAYLLNSGQNDISTAVDSYLDIIFNGLGDYIALDEFILRCKVQSVGDITVTTYANEVEQFTETLSMLAENTGEAVRRHWLPWNLIDQLIRIRIQHDTIDEDMELYDMGLSTSRWEGR